MKRKATLILSPIIALIIYVTLTSGANGQNAVSTTGCSCHDPLPSPNTIVSISGLPPAGYVNGTVYSLTVSVTNTVIAPATGSGTFGLRDGFDLTSSAGSFTAVAGTSLDGSTEILHNTPRTSIGGTSSWTFNWTAPASGNAIVTFNLAGNATNGDDSPGFPDSWNLYTTTVSKAFIPLAASATSSAIACNGGVSTITANTGGTGVSPYTYKLNAGSFQASASFTNNLAGTYTITAKDATTATASTVITINQPLIVIATTSASPILCNGGTSSITVNATGGTGSFTYKLNTGTYQQSNTFVGNLAASYTVTARDANLCAKTSTVIIGAAPSLITLTSPVLTNVVCYGSATGSAAISASGGTGAKTFTITPMGPQSNTTGFFSGLTSQTYTITATDANACTKTTAVIINQSPEIIFGPPSITQPICNGGSGTVALSATSGTGAKTYTIAPLGPQSNTAGLFTGLVAQTYTVTATDAANCSKTMTFIMGQPSPLNITASNANGCPGVAISLLGIPSGGTFSVANPYTGPSTTFTYTFTDSNGCSGTSLPATITVTPCGTLLNLNLFLQGYYIGSGFMSSVLMNQGIGNGSTICDTITVELHDPITPSLVAETKKLILNTDGTATGTFISATGPKYIAVRHRNSVQTWSASPVIFGAGIVNYNFTDAITKSFGDNMFETEPGVWAFYCGDIAADENIDLIDLALLEIDVSNFLYGYYDTDLNGDGNVDLLDSPILEANVNAFIYSAHP